MIIEVLNFSNSIQSLYKAFENCINLTTIPTNTPDSLIDLSFAFCACTKLKNPIQRVGDSVLYMVHTYDRCTFEKAYDFPKNVIDIVGCYSYCRNLKNAPDLPENVKSAKYLFASTNITFPPKINDKCVTLSNAFEYCKNLIEMPDIPDSVIYMDDSFKNTSITTVKKLPDGIKTLLNSFSNCEELVEITNIPSNVTDISNCFKGCINLRKINLSYSDFPKAEKFDSTFEGCEKLKNTIKGKPTKLTSCKRMYYGCTSLEEILDNIHTIITPESKVIQKDMYFGCFNIKKMNDEEFSIYDLYYYNGGLPHVLSVKIEIPNDNYPVTVTYGIPYLWDKNLDCIADPNQLTKVYNKGEYTLMIFADYDERYACIDNIELVTEIFNVPIDFRMKEAFKNFINLKKCCSLRRLLDPDWTSCFENCKSLEYAPEVTNYVEKFDKGFFNSGINSICNIPQYLETATFLFAGCLNLENVDVKLNPYVTSIESLFEGDVNLIKLKLDLSEITTDVMLYTIVAGCRNLKNKNFELILPKTGEIDFRYMLTNYFNGDDELYRIPDLDSYNRFGPCRGLYGNLEDTVSEYKTSYTNLVMAGLYQEEAANIILGVFDDKLVNKIPTARKCHNLWKYFPELETKQVNKVVEGGASVPHICSNYTFTGNREIDTFIDYKTGEETYGSYGLIPEAWGGSYSADKNIIAVRVRAGSTINIIKDNDSFIDFGSYSAVPTKKNSFTYKKAGKYFITSTENFDFASDSCEFVVEICNLKSDCVIGKKSMNRFKNLVYCPVIFENETGDYTDYFANCHALKFPPEIPANAKICDRMFTCTNIKNAPTIPESVISCQSIFDECKNLVTDTRIPNGVKNCKFAFRNCFALKDTVQDFTGYASDIESENCFKGTEIENIPDGWK